jgi:prophage antirepressor-like protein
MADTFQSVTALNFHLDSINLRIIMRGDEPWFVAADVCAALEIVNSRDALSRLDDDEKGVGSTDTLGGKQEVAIVNESGLYSLILTSRKPEARRFKKWVTAEVLPAIRRTGRFESGTHIGSADGIDKWVAFDDAYEAFVKAYPMLGLGGGSWAAINLRRNFGQQLLAAGAVLQLKNRRWIAHRDTFGPALFSLLNRSAAEIIEKALQRRL